MNDAELALDETLTAEAATVPLLRELVTTFARSSGLAGERLDALRLAVTEAVTNAVIHAYIEDEAPGNVSLGSWVEAGLLYVRVSDAGRGMLPRLDSPGLGLGLPLIAQSTESLDVHSTADGGTAVLMAFRLG